METKTQHVCPWWLGFLLVNPFRKWYHNPETLLKPFVKPGMKVVDYGVSMGYFSLPLARLTGETGRVYAIDIQQKMINWLYKRSRKAGLSEVISPMLITPNADFSELTGHIDFALLFAMVHEVPDQRKLFHTLAGMIKSGGRVLFAEPRGHVGLAAFELSVAGLCDAGFAPVMPLKIKGSHAVLLEKK